MAIPLPQPNGPAIDIPHFYGVAHNRMTPKSQVALPATFRSTCSDAVLSARFMLRQRTPEDRHLNLYPEAAFARERDRVRERLEAMADRDRAGRLWRSWFENTHALSIDGQGRITLPKAMLTQVGIHGPDLMFLGCDTRIELWDPAQYQRERLPDDEYRRWLAENRDLIGL